MKGYGYSRQSACGALMTPAGLVMLGSVFCLGYYAKTWSIERGQDVEGQKQTPKRLLPRNVPHGSVAGASVLRGSEEKEITQTKSSVKTGGGFLSNKDEPAKPINHLTKEALTPQQYQFSELIGSPKILAYPHKNDWALPGDNGNWWMSLHGWEPETQITYKTILERASKANKGKAVVIDFGTWIGPTVLLSAVHDVGGRVIGLEPDRQAFSEAWHNLHLNADKVKAGQVELYELCISDKKGELEMFGAPGDSMSTLAPMEHEKAKPGFQSWKVECTDLPSFLSSGAPKSNIVPISEGGTFEPVNPEDIALIKIDTEGHERHILPALKPFISKYKPNIFLSLHVFMYEAPTDAHYHQALLDVIRLYKYALLPDGQNANDPTSGFTIVGWCRLCTLLLTDEEAPEGKTWAEVFKIKK